MRKGGLFILLMLIGTYRQASGQVGVTVLSAPVISVNSANAYNNGVTSTQTSIRLTAARRITWELSVRASGDAVSGRQSIPINQFGLRVTNVDLTTYPTKFLSTAYQLIASDYVARQSDRTTDVSIQYTLLSGPHLLKPAGTYVTTLTFLITQL